MRRIELVYLCPRGEDRVFEARLARAIQRIAPQVRIANQLLGVTQDPVFLSPTLPNVVVVRDGEVVAQAIGELPQRELEDMLGAALAA
jgi:glucokinase